MEQQRNVLFETQELCRNFGALKATDHVSIRIYEGEMHAIIGPNGAGKSTLMDLIINRTCPTEGKVFFQGKEITGVPPYAIANMGISKCFQISKLFAALTCFENIRIALIKHRGETWSLLPRKKNYLWEECRQILDMVGMADKMEETAALLSYGDQRRLEIAITLAMEPVLLMLDEPTAGVARAEGYEIMKMIRELAKKQNFTVVFIEHDMDIVFHYSDRISVLSSGRLIVTDSPQKVRENQFVQDAYFGGAGV